MPKKSKEKTELKLENVLVLNIVIFSVVAILHFSRIVLRVPVYIWSFQLPIWLSLAAVLILVFVIWQNWIKTEKTKKVCAKIVMGILMIDLAGVIYAFYHNIEFFGFTRTAYVITAAFEVAIIAGLFWYIQKS